MTDVQWARLPIGKTLRVQAAGALKTRTGNVILKGPLKYYDEDDVGLEPLVDEGQMMIRAEQVSGKRITDPIRLLGEWGEVDGKNIPVWSILPTPEDWKEMHIGDAPAGGGGWKGGGGGGKPKLTRAQWEEAMRQSFELTHLLTGEKPSADAVFPKVAGDAMFVNPKEWKPAVGKALDGKEIDLPEPEPQPDIEF